MTREMGTYSCSSSSQRRGTAEHSTGPFNALRPSRVKFAVQTSGRKVVRRGGREREICRRTVRYRLTGYLVCPSAAFGSAAHFRGIL